MIDNKTYQTTQPDSEAFKNSSHELKYSLDPFPTSIFHDACLDELTLILLPANIYGFYLKEKRWGECQSWIHD